MGILGTRRKINSDMEYSAYTPFTIWLAFRYSLRGSSVSSFRQVPLIYYWNQKKIGPLQNSQFPSFLRTCLQEPPQECIEAQLRVSFKSPLYPGMVMRRIQFFLIVLTVALSILMVLFAVSMYLAATAQAYYQSSWMGQMWGGMMGNGNHGSAPSYYWVIPAVLIGVAVVGVVGLAFYYALPEIRMGNAKCASPEKSPAPAIANMNSPVDAFDTVSKTMTPEERRVLEVLKVHGGSYLQKYIRNEAGLSRLKTHRIVARFAERGIVTVQQSGNTNEVILCDWLQSPKP